MNKNDDIYYNAAHLTGNDDIGWTVLLQAPDDQDDFLVIYQSKKLEDCKTVLDALNNLIQSHIKHYINLEL